VNHRPGLRAVAVSEIGNVFKPSPLQLDFDRRHGALSAFEAKMFRRTLSRDMLSRKWSGLEVAYEIAAWGREDLERDA
jgi:hypothetical protein